MNLSIKKSIDQTNQSIDQINSINGVPKRRNFQNSLIRLKNSHGIINVVKLTIRQILSLLYDEKIIFLCFFSDDDCGLNMTLEQKYASVEDFRKSQDIQW